MFWEEYISNSNIQLKKQKAEIQWKIKKENYLCYYYLIWFNVKCNFYDIYCLIWRSNINMQENFKLKLQSKTFTESSKTETCKRWCMKMLKYTETQLCFIVSNPFILFSLIKQSINDFWLYFTIDIFFNVCSFKRDEIMEICKESCTVTGKQTDTKLQLSRDVCITETATWNSQQKLT